MVSHHWRWSLLLWFLAGCSQQQAPLGPTEISGLRERALECLKLGISYEYLPTVRAHAVEALQETTGDEALPWMRHALLDEHPAVRFAAGVALGTRRDELAAPMIRKMLHSDQSSDRIAACFALYRLGEAERAADLATYLLDDVDPAVRANAALVLGRMEEPGAIKLLARVMREEDPGLQANALEAMLLLGAAEARSALYANAYGGIGAEETMAINALARLRDPALVPLFEEKLSSANHLETRLAAARGLGLLGYDDGSALATASLKYKADKGMENDPAANRTLRVRQMAALALGAIGDQRALPSLQQMMNDGGDPRWQLAAAKAILEILNTQESVP